MITITDRTKIYIARASIDFRCGIDSLGGVIKNNFGKDPMDGSLFVFTNRRRDGIKFLFYDFQGFWIAYKRFSQGRLSWWPSAGEDAGGISALDYRNLIMLIYNGDLEMIKSHSDWKKLK